MPESRFRLLRGAFDREEWFQAPQRGGPEPVPLPPRDPLQHVANLVAQLDAIVTQVQARPPDQRDVEAMREIIAFRPESESELSPGSLADGRSDARLVAEDPDSGLVLVDVPSPELQYLRRKLTRYAETPPEGVPRKNERAIAPVAAVSLATGNDRAGPRIRADRPRMEDVRWLEIACRGGERAETGDTESSRRQVTRTLERLGHRAPQEFLATERIVFFVRLSMVALRELLASTDCVYEFDLAAPDIRGWLMVNDPDFPVRELRDFRWTPPRPDAPAVVTLDTGAVSGHPMLSSALLSAHSVVQGDNSPEDTHGHGTRMAGIALYDDVAEAAERNEAEGTHWIQAVKLLTGDGVGSASAENREFWPALTRDAVGLAESLDARPRVFAMAVTAEHEDPAAPTWWSHAIDRLAFAGGRGRVFCVSAGNVQEVNLGFIEGYPQVNLDELIEDPAHAANALTIGAYTAKTRIPPNVDYAGARSVAPEGGVAPCTRAGLHPADGDAIKPDVVFEGGNYAAETGWVVTDLDSLADVSIGPNFLQNPLVTHRDTSLATAHAARFVARVWDASPDLRPETVRGLVVHSAEWTPQMVRQLPNLDERLSLCGYGVPDLSVATACARECATVIIEDRIAGAVRDEADDGRAMKRRAAKFFRFPVPEGLLLEAGDVELRVTLSYFAEPNKIARRQYRGLNLRWDMQGPTETEDEFRQRVNALARGENYQRTTSSFPWVIRKQRRSRGTVQSDRWSGPGSYLAGAKWLAVHPVLGWWERRGLEFLEMPFSLIVTVRAANGVDIYTPIQTALSATVEILGA